MDLRKAAAFYAIGTGGTLAGIWIALLATGHDVVSGTGAFPFTDHLVPEALTVVGLLLAGVGLLRGERWGLPAFLVASGLFAYSALSSVGFYLGRGEPALAASFAGLAALAGSFLGAAVVGERRWRRVVVADPLDPEL